MLGVIVTAHTTLGGTKMIFRYPPVIRDKVRQQQCFFWFCFADALLFVSSWCAPQVSLATLREFAAATGKKDARAEDNQNAGWFALRSLRAACWPCVLFVLSFVFVV